MATGGVKSTAMTRIEAEHIFATMMGSIAWGEVVKESNRLLQQETGGKERKPGNVKTHWDKFVRRTILDMYADA